MLKSEAGQKRFSRLVMCANKGGDGGGLEVWGRDGHVSAGDWECELEPSRFSPTSVPRKAKLLEALSFFGKISLPMSSTGALRPRGQAPI